MFATCFVSFPHLIDDFLFVMTRSKGLDYRFAAIRCSAADTFLIFSTEDDIQYHAYPFPGCLSPVKPGAPMFGGIRSIRKKNGCLVNALKGVSRACPIFFLFSCLETQSLLVPYPSRFFLRRE